MLRVLKPQGKLYLYVPNYLYPHEGHYKIFLPPLLPKPLARIYLRMRGRKPDFINDINYTTYYWIMRILKKYPVQIEDWSEKELNQLMKKATFLRKVQFKFLKMLKLYPNIKLFVTKTR